MALVERKLECSGLGRQIWWAVPLKWKGWRLEEVAGEVCSLQEVVVEQIGLQ